MTDNAMQGCIESCWDARTECQKTLFNHCLVEGGKHVEQSHVKLMMDCIEICQTTADFLVRQSELHVGLCAVCADVCEACASSCEKFDSAEMKHCAEACRQCAKQCRTMNRMQDAA